VLVVGREIPQSHQCFLQTDVLLLQLFEFIGREAGGIAVAGDATDGGLGLVPEFGIIIDKTTKINARIAWDILV